MMIITDSASDITKQEALEMNIRIVSLKIRFSDGEFHQNTEEDFSVFFEKLAAEKVDQNIKVVCAEYLYL